MLAWTRNATLSRLERRMMTEKELSEAIVKKAKAKFEDITGDQLRAISAAAVALAYEQKALDDGAYARQKTDAAVRNGKSKRFIAQTLSAKGVDTDVAASALKDTDDLYAAVVFARKRAFGPYRRGEADDKRKAKELSAFARNGFGFTIGNAVFEMSADEADAILAG
ncbi:MULTISPECIES: regulatory protein RecX [Rhizobium]|uniref:Regulatory protein RecX n=1 Tax=Rhizobium rhododendri TaxID=2506430 RepID=A0ABY8ILS9_9HYPH|nr:MULTISPECIES: regulatory protein RecX [Rhizobium]MBZ5760654.1 recombination regulator RecX [Rhizobium sp. VS19-DR96]MBZ5765562.1 recombination regulator RecX [Rhizobium sp. VS19-DR129.2]MBZ5774481.1 recombination regulator RecX [Rhizobium sp. VS19-DRK62.2]MBZ5784489.1 recombination regulator RecX [Rhizobium sp. VS19-DR121]MBZ5801101.1 recombination regulator RecX [Rhizobium sp. VS19-DR181]